jgi:two-component system cell cycle sensor histidine kinase/response regulator CckA
MLAAQTGAPTQPPAAVRTEAVGTLAAGLAHDLNSMLGGIMATAELVAGRMPPGSTEARDLDAIVAQAGRAGELVRQILAFSRQEILHPERFLLGDMVKALEPVLRAVAGLSIHVDLEADGKAGVSADRTALERVLMNLIVNARDAILGRAEGARGRILVSTARVRATALPAAGAAFMERRDYATLAVADDGPGVPQSIAARIFEPYFTTKPQGQGLGLASAFGVVKQSGGYLLLDEGPLGGARFTCFLPLVGAAAPVSRDGPAPAASRHLLLVEDEPLLRASLARGLEVAGFRVTMAADGEEAIGAFADADDVALLLTDIRMPGMDGIELARRVRERAPRLPVLLMSGYADEAARAAVPGMDVGFIAKPATLKALSDRIEGLIAH